MSGVDVRDSAASAALASDAAHRATVSESIPGANELKGPGSPSRCTCSGSRPRVPSWRICTGGATRSTLRWSPGHVDMYNGVDGFLPDLAPSRSCPHAGTRTTRVRSIIAGDEWAWAAGRRSNRLCPKLRSSSSSPPLVQPTVLTFAHRAQKSCARTVSSGDTSLSLLLRVLDVDDACSGSVADEECIHQEDAVCWGNSTRSRSSSPPPPPSQHASGNSSSRSEGWRRPLLEGFQQTGVPATSPPWVDKLSRMPVMTRREAASRSAAAARSSGL
ncbi:hypothetical protein B0H15DRAFT_988315 [Mycena belliarum]|uniref:Uncharacterized protein n=1 Tax=Mycena belliarum TaxID=1033014 RepID=A0AAD6U030_9AGAR|nr:hypothetical protein B0H15DRAFT_988315 [Mycena belliae]